MAFKIAANNQLGEHILQKGGNGTGIESEFFFVWRNKGTWQYHVTDSQRGRNGFGKGVQVNDVVVGREGIQRFGRLR